LPINPFSQCAGKVAYKTCTEAARAMKALERRRCKAKPHPGLKPYHCAICHQWHLGRPPQGQIKQMRRLRDRFDRKHPFGA
jgi:hypothetical protein